MAGQMSKPARRFAVLVNYLCIIGCPVLFYFGSDRGWSVPLMVGLGLAIAVGLVSFVMVQVRTRLWKLVHTKADELDEREVQVTHESLRHSYSIFTIVSLLVLMVIALFGGWRDSLLIIIFAGLLYLAHTLPASILAWTEKEVQG